jgi:hypothetical protein
MPITVQMQPSLVISGHSDPSTYTKKMLAQGDSWFSIGALPPWATSSLLLQLNLKSDSCTVNCAHPGDLLSKMVDQVQDDEFEQLLCGNSEMRWDAILLSGGGNDLINAIQVPPIDPSTGNPFDPSKRLLLVATEWGNQPDASRYVSEEGWTAFANYLTAAYQAFIDVRAKSKQNSTTTIFCHTYDFATPRPAPAATWPVQVGPWLYYAVQTYGIPQKDWFDLATMFINRMATLIESFKFADFVVVKTLGTLTPAEIVAGPSGGWENEIHATRDGYKLLTALWAKAIGF